MRFFGTFLSFVATCSCLNKLVARSNKPGPTPHTTRVQVRCRVVLCLRLRVLACLLPCLNYMFVGAN